jgi:Ribbon-helix-helix protein, copG family
MMQREHAIADIGSTNVPMFPNSIWPSAGWIFPVLKGKGRMVQPIQRVNVDLTATMLKELDKAAEELNVSRQAVIKTLVRQALDHHYLARHAKQSQL